MTSETQTQDVTAENTENQDAYVPPETPVNDFATRCDVFTEEAVEEYGEIPEGKNYGSYRWKDGIDKDWFAKRFGLKDSSVHQTITKIKDFLYFGSHQVEYDGEEMNGLDLMDIPELKLNNVGNFLKFCEEEMAKPADKRKVTWTIPGAEFPGFEASRKREAPKLRRFLRRK